MVNSLTLLLKWTSLLLERRPTNSLKPTIDHPDTLDWQAQQTQRGGNTLCGHLTTVNYTLFSEARSKCQPHKPARGLHISLLVKSPADHFDVSLDTPVMLSYCHSTRGGINITHRSSVRGLIPRSRCNITLANIIPPCIMFWGQFMFQNVLWINSQSPLGVCVAVQRLVFVLL